MATDYKVPTGDGDYYYAWGQAAWVDEYPTPDDGDYNYLTWDPGGYYYFTFDAFAVPAGATIQQVVVTFRAWTDNTTPVPQYVTSVKVGGIYGYGTVWQNLTLSPTTYDQNNAAACCAFTKNPKSGVAWTVNDVNGSGDNALQQFGLYGACTNNVPYMYFSQIYVTVFYGYVSAFSGCGVTLTTARVYSIGS